MRYIDPANLFQRVYGVAGSLAEVAEAEPTFEMAEELLDLLLRTTLTAESNTAKLVDGTGDSTLWLPKHVRSVTKVEVLQSGEWVDIPDFTLVQKSERITDGATPRNPLYYAITVEGFQSTNEDFPLGTRNVRVTGNWGCAPNGQYVHLPIILTNILPILVKRVDESLGRDPSIRIDSGLNRMIEYFSPADSSFSSVVGGILASVATGYTIQHSINGG